MFRRFRFFFLSFFGIWLIGRIYAGNLLQPETNINDFHHEKSAEIRLCYMDLPDEIILKIHDYCENRNLMFVSKRGYLIIEKWYDLKIRLEYPKPYYDFIRNGRDKPELKRVSRFFTTEFAYEVFPVLESVWRREQAALSSIENLDEWFSQLLSKLQKYMFAEEETDFTEVVYYTETMMPRMMYILLDMKLPGFRIFSRFIGPTSLEWAIDLDNYQRLSELLESGTVQVNIVDLRGDTPLIFAAKMNSPAMTQLLLENGANPNFFFRGMLCSPLHLAASQGNIELIQLLLDYGADRNIKDVCGEKPWEYAFRLRNRQLVELLRTDETPADLTDLELEFSESSSIGKLLEWSEPIHAFIGIICGVAFDEVVFFPFTSICAFLITVEIIRYISDFE